MSTLAAARSKPAEDEWISRLRRGDAIAIAELVACYEPRIRQQAMRYVPRHEDAEEIAQDVLVKVWRKLHLFRGDAALSSWVHRITFNTAMSRLRNTRVSRTREVASDAEPGKLPNAMASRAHDMPDWTGMADESVLRSEMRAKLAEAIAVMPVIYRRPVVLRDLEGLSIAEVSTLLNLNKQTLKSRVHRGRQFLRRRLAVFAGGLTLHRRALADR
ncbi:MAG TPA: sigma-70 family RNA polymerase sigma factor [Vicinamibacterales bacterium]|jgi:RNA polymerase sigma-70 factor (ECF subfamily)|nr:sigma-70 family RNA polymerase sigma factor [Vicinamibacterales bacterium]